MSSWSEEICINSPQKQSINRAFLTQRTLPFKECIFIRSTSFQFLYQLCFLGPIFNAEIDTHGLFNIEWNVLVIYDAPEYFSLCSSNCRSNHQNSDPTFSKKALLRFFSGDWSEKSSWNQKCTWATASLVNNDLLCWLLWWIEELGKCSSEVNVVHCCHEWGCTLLLRTNTCNTHSTKVSTGL